MSDLIERAKAALEGATPGPWHVQKDPEAALDIGYFVGGGGFARADMTGPGAAQGPNARLIALAPDIARALIDSTAERDAAIAREKALLASNQEERTALVEAASLRRERDALRAQLATARADALREAHERLWDKLGGQCRLEACDILEALIYTPTPSAPSPEAVARAALVDMIAQLPDGDVRIEVELVHGGWCGYVLVSPDNGPISPASPDRIYARTRAMPTRNEAVAEIPATIAATVAKAGGGE